MAKQAVGSTPWSNAPAEVLTAFEMMWQGSSKSEAASKAGTSTRTLGRWSDKYDFDGYVADREANMTVAERAQHLFRQWKADATEATLAAHVEFKKARKKGWQALGFSATQERQILKAIA